MEKNIVLLILVFSITLGSGGGNSGGKQVDKNQLCKIPEMKGKNARDCDSQLEAIFHNKDVTQHCLGKKFNRKVKNAVSDCFDGVLKRDLKNRYKFLKANKTQLKLEKNIQSKFEKAKKSYCNIYLKCKKIDKPVYISHCNSELLRYRAYQVEKTNTADLIYSKEFIKFKHPKAMKDFAKIFCEIPAIIWRRQQKPEKCQETILSSVAASVQPTCPKI